MKLVSQVAPTVKTAFESLGLLRPPAEVTLREMRSEMSDSILEKPEARERYLEKRFPALVKDLEKRGPRKWSS